MTSPITSLSLLPTNLLAEDLIPSTCKEETKIAVVQPGASTVQRQDVLHSSIEERVSLKETSMSEEGKKTQSAIRRFFCCGNSAQE